MAHMAHNYRVIFHKPPLSGTPSSWAVKAELVTAFSQEVAERLARQALALDHEWQVRKIEDLGKWNKVQELMS